MIIPLTMINRMDFSFTYTKPANYALFKIITEKQDFYVKLVYAENNTNYLNKIQVLRKEKVLYDAY